MAADAFHCSDGEMITMPDERPDPDPDLLAKIDSTVPHSARIWNYWLGGKDNYPVDHEAGDEFAKIFPGIVDAARGSRYFLARVVRHLTANLPLTLVRVCAPCCLCAFARQVGRSNSGVSR